MGPNRYLGYHRWYQLAPYTPLVRIQFTRCWWVVEQLPRLIFTFLVGHVVLFPLAGAILMVYISRIRQDGVVWARSSSSFTTSL